MGIGVLTAISIIGALGVSVIPHEYVGFLGLVPIYLGIKKYVDHKKESESNRNTGRKNFKMLRIVNLKSQQTLKKTV